MAEARKALSLCDDPHCDVKRNTVVMEEQEDPFAFTFYLMIYPINSHSGERRSKYCNFDDKEVACTVITTQIVASTAAATVPATAFNMVGMVIVAFLVPITGI